MVRGGRALNDARLARAKECIVDHLTYDLWPKNPCNSIMDVAYATRGYTCWYSSAFRGSNVLSHASISSGRLKAKTKLVQEIPPGTDFENIFALCKIFQQFCLLLLLLVLLM